jgi:2'-5' RNA ligase
VDAAWGSIDHLVVTNTLPWLPEEPIASFRRAHYPGGDLIAPHLTVVFPVPAAVGIDAFEEHVRGIVWRTPAFDIHLNGLAKTWDHWLYLAVAEGRDEVIALHDDLYTGILRPYLLTERPYVPHVGLGLFAEERDTHDLLALRPRAFHRARFDEALKEAEALQLDYMGRFETVRVFGLDEGLTHVTRLEEIPLRATED